MHNKRWPFLIFRHMFINWKVIEFHFKLFCFDYRTSIKKILILWLQNFVYFKNLLQKEIDHNKVKMFYGFKKKVKWNFVFWTSRYSCILLCSLVYCLMSTTWLNQYWTWHEPSSEGSQDVMYIYVCFSTSLLCFTSSLYVS